MQADWTQTALGGVLRRRAAGTPDERGSFAELWRGSWTDDHSPSFAQANLSRSRAGVLRGLHFHLRQTDLWVVLDGRAHVALADLRPQLAGAGDAPPPQLAMILEAGDSVLIPPGVAHGFWALSDVDLLYLVTNEYDGTDEHGFAWDDPLAAIRWPSAGPMLSARDASAPSLADAIAGVRQAGHSSET